MGKIRARPPMAKVIAAVLVVGFGTMAFAGGLWSTPSAEPAVESFLLAWQQGDYGAAAALTTGKPAQVAAALGGAYQQLDAAAFYLQMGPIVQHGATATAGFNASVDLGQNGPPWTYYGQFQLRLVGSQWRIVWAPSVINPELRPGYRLAVRSVSQPRQNVLDSAGHPLEVPSIVDRLGVYPGQLPHPLHTARALGRITGLDWSQLLGLIQAAPTSGFQELVTVPHDWYLAHAAALSRVPGLRDQPKKLRLFNSIAPAVVGRVEAEASSRLRDEGIAYRPGATIGLSGLQSAFQRQLAGTPTTEVVLETAAGRQVSTLAKWGGSAAQPVQTTLDGGLQQAAEHAVGSLPVSAVVVAVDATTGQILAVARHRASGLPKISPLGRGYPPGMAFTIVSTAALLARPVGLQVNTPEPCLKVNSVGGATVRNIPPVRGAGANATFADDFAHACATGFVSQALGLTARELNQTASEFGLGLPWPRLPLQGFSGTVQASGGYGQLAADMLGRGTVRVSPLAMALAAARVDAGTWHQPILVPSYVPHAVVTPSKTSRFSAASLNTLRGLMQAAARANGLARAGHPAHPVFGQTGTAPLLIGKRGLWANWFVGYRGHVAFAVLEISGSRTNSAVPLAKGFLDAAPRG